MFVLNIGAYILAGIAKNGINNTCVSINLEQGFGSGFGSGKYLCEVAEARSF